jgi:hypothetical protein
MKTNLIYWINALADAKRIANHNPCTGNFIAIKDIHRKIAEAALDVIAEAA